MASERRFWLLVVAVLAALVWYQHSQRVRTCEQVFMLDDAFEDLMLVGVPPLGAPDFNQALIRSVENTTDEEKIVRRHLRRARGTC